jgi:ubiquinone/menaquinone biosynthesis C-methylase UbiE
MQEKSSSPSTTVQVEKGHYLTQRYNHKARWLSYWYQIDAVLGFRPSSILEVGIGSGMVRDYLRKCGAAVTTLDIDPDVNPDVVGSVLSMPLGDGEFDCVLAAEILEHLPFEDFPAGLREIRRVSRRSAVVSLPDARRTLCNASLKIPFLPALRCFAQVPTFRQHVFNGQHYWELGKRGYGIRTIEAIMRRSGWRIRSSFTPADVTTKRFFLLEKA